MILIVAEYRRARPVVPLQRLVRIADDSANAADSADSDGAGSADSATTKHILKEDAAALHPYRNEACSLGQAVCLRRGLSVTSPYNTHRTTG